MPLPQLGHSRDQVQSLDLVEILRCNPLADHQGPSATKDGAQCVLLRYLYKSLSMTLQRVRMLLIK